MYAKRMGCVEFPSAVECDTAGLQCDLLVIKTLINRLKFGSELHV